MRIIQKEFFLDKQRLFELIQRSSPTNISVLDNTFATDTDLSSAIANLQSQLNSKVSKNGDTINSNVSLLDIPIHPTHIVNKSYVDSVVSTVISSTVTPALSNKVSRTGDTMVGDLLLANPATQDFHPVVKRQFDQELSNVVKLAATDW
jgi:hypothetical protein